MAAVFLGRVVVVAITYILISNRAARGRGGGRPY